jgi:hypothetical protein
MRTAAASLAFFCVTAGFAQTRAEPGQPAQTDPPRQVSYNLAAYYDAPRFPLPPPVVDLPFSFEEVIEYSGPRGDGSRLVRKVSQGRTVRDSRGRIRRESPATFPPAPVLWGARSAVVGPGIQPGQTLTAPSPLAAMPELQVPVTIELSDPVARTRCHLDAQNRVAHCSLAEFSFPSPNIDALPPAMAFVDSGPSEPLGPRTIDGVDTVGRRTRETVEYRGERVTVVSETWFSTDLRITMLRHTVDPRFGESTYRLEGFSRAEPDPGAFYPPSGYVVQQETGSYKIEYSNQ